MIDCQFGLFAAVITTALLRFALAFNISSGVMTFCAKFTRAVAVVACAFLYRISFNPITIAFQHVLAVILVVVALLTALRFTVFLVVKTISFAPCLKVPLAIDPVYFAHYFRMSASPLTSTSRSALFALTPKPVLVCGIWGKVRKRLFFTAFRAALRQHMRFSPCNSVFGCVGRRTEFAFRTGHESVLSHLPIIVYSAWRGNDGIK